MQYRDLATAGIDENNLHKAAISNLYSPAEKNLKIQPYGSIFATFMEGNFEASVLLLDTVWDISLKQHVRENFVVAIPARDVLAFGDSSSADAIAELNALVERVVGSADHPLSTSLYTHPNGAWAKYHEQRRVTN